MVSNKQKIGYLLKVYPRLSETFIMNEVLELERQGLALHIFSLRFPQNEEFNPTGSKVQADVTYLPSLKPTLKFINYLILSWANLQLFSQNPWRYLKVRHNYFSQPEPRKNLFLQAGYLVLELQKHGIKHLHAHFANVPANVAELMHRLSGITYSFTAHAKDIYLTESEVLNQRIKQAKFVLTCTAYNQKYLQGISTNDTPIYLSYHGLDLTRFQPDRLSDRLPSTNPVILSVGRFCEKKGFPYLLKACQLLKQKGLVFDCKIVGYGPLQTEMEQLIEELDIKDVVFLLGKMMQDDLIELYRQTDIFALPCIISEDGDRDGIPNVLLEAMAMEIPVVSTHISGIVELIEDRETGILVPPKNAESLAEALAELITNPQLSQQIKLGLRSKIFQQFSLEFNVKQVKDLLLGN